VAPETPEFALRCEALATLWRDTATLCNPELQVAGSHNPQDFGGCFGAACACRMPGMALMDPTHVEIDCPSFMRRPPWPPSADREAWRPLLTAGQGQWHQDWYLWHRLFAPLPEAPRMYVDVGAGAPFFLSRTAALDQCLGWDGLCVEPHPRLWQPLRLHRSCALERRCVAGPDGHGRRLFKAAAAGKDGAGEGDRTEDFEAECTSLAEVLRHAGLARPARVDVLSLEAGGEEAALLRGFPFEDFDVSVVVARSSRPPAVRALDAVLLPMGFLKVAVLGLDAVYAHGGHVASLHAAGAQVVAGYPPWVFRAPYEEPFWAFQQRFVEPGFGEL